jgi:hypothetical protein
MEQSGRSAVVALLALIAAAVFGGCQSLPQHSDEQPQTKPDAAQKQQAEQSARQRKQAAERAALKQHEAELAVLHRDCLNAVEQMKEINVRWQEAQRAADASPRITLQVPIANLRKIRQELEDWRGSPCLDKAKADLAQGMDLTIGYIVKFKANDRKYLSGERAKTAQGHSDRQTANDLLDSVVAQLSRLEGCKGAC